MNPLKAIWRRLRSLGQQRAVKQEIDEELRFHVEQRTAEYIAKGMPQEEAAREARRRFGNVQSVREECRETRGANFGEATWRDIRFGLRMLRKNPGFTTVAVLTLAVGIGANTSLFTALDVMLLKPLGTPGADRLVYFTSGNTETFSFPDYERMRNALSTVSGFAATQNGAPRRDLVVTGSSAAETESVSAQAVTGNFFAVLDVPALLGRTLSADDDRPGAGQPVMIISHGFWKRRFAADPQVLGRAVQFDGVPVTIIGVMPPDFAGFEVGPNPDVWFPVQLVTQLGPRDRNLLAEGVDWLVLFARLGPGVTREQAQAEVSVIVRQRLDSQVATNPKLTAAERERILSQTVQLHSGAAGYVGARRQFKQPLVVLMVAVAVVLLIACANVAGLLLARGAARQREFAVRAALGSGRGRIVRQLVTESLLLAALAGALGLVFAQWGTRFLGTYLAQSSNTAVRLEPDVRVLLFTITVSFLTAMVFGLIPAWRLSRLDLIAAIKQQGGLLSGGGRLRLQPTLVVSQVALTVLLLAVAGLFARTLYNLRTVELGFQRDNLLTLSIDPGRWRPSSPAQSSLMLQRLLEEFETIPGVRSASIAGAGMLSGNGYNTSFEVEGYAPALGEELRAAVVFAGPNFFLTLQAPLLRGREFTTADTPAPSTTGPAKPATVAILGETMARRFFGDADPVGRHLTLAGGMLNGVRLEVIGVAKDTKYSRNLREQTSLELYLPFFGSAVRMPPTIYLRSEHSAAALAGSLRQVIARVEPQVTLRDLRPMDEVIDRLLVRERIIAQLVGFFSTFALLLASLGVYGLLSYGVARRAREIGVRVALGAQRSNILSLVISQGFKLVILGAVIGIAGALVATRLVSSLFFGVTATDPFTFGSVLLLLLAVALLASWLPARRATRIDPLEALRSE